jgi:hypothetical protein
VVCEILVGVFVCGILLCESCIAYFCQNMQNDIVVVMNIVQAASLFDDAWCLECYRGWNTSNLDSVPT